MLIINLKFIFIYLLMKYVELTICYDLEREKELIEIINSNPNSTWVAGYNNVSDKEPFHILNTHNVEQKNNLTKKLFPYFDLFFSSDIPASFDAREKWSSTAGNGRDKCPFLRKVYNGGKCKCGWAISIASVVSDRLCISSNYKINLPLSAQHLISCCENCCNCNGGDVLHGWEYVKQKGLVTGGSFNSDIGCQPFLMAPCQRTYECSSANLNVHLCMENACKPSANSVNNSNVQYESNVKTRIYDYYSLSREKPVIIMKNIMEYGPLQVSMHVYEDFRVYTKGIYTHITGEFITDHGVKLIGWGIENGHRYWLLMNSFGLLWGDHGLFKIPQDGTDNAEFGYAIIAPKFKKNVAHTTLYSSFLICLTLLFAKIND